MSLDRYVGRPLKTKGDAEKEADKVRMAIRDGAFSPVPQPTTPPTADALTLDAYTDIFLERYSKARQKASWKSDRSILKHVRDFTLSNGRRFGTKAIGAVTEDDVEACLQALKDRGLAASTRNKYLQMFKVMSAWGHRKGYLSRPWIGLLTDLKREKHARRDRRLQPGEESRLLKAASRRLYRLIVAAVETGCREAELLRLLWRDVNLAGQELTVRAENAKDHELRHIPMTKRLCAVLEMAQHDPAGHRFGPSAFVFGDAVGHYKPFPRKAWVTLVLKAHGHTPVWVGKAKLAPESRAAYRAIDLTFHDLRHEAGSEWLEMGVPLHHIKELLGHANIATTDTYLNAGRVHLRESLLRAEARKFGKPVANTDEEVVGQATDQRDDADGKSLLN